MHEVVIVGGGFGGLYAAKGLKRAPVHVTLVDRRNFHLFQPLLYQVATGTLSPSDISAPLRAVLSRQANATVYLAEVVDLDPRERRVILGDGALTYDTLLIATGSSHHYFGHEEWAAVAPGLKTIEDATHIRRRVLLAFEAAEREPDHDARRALLTFVIVGAGPTGVELAGALAEIARETLRHDFRHIDPREARVILLEGADRVLPSYPPELSAAAADALVRRGVEVDPKTMVTAVDAGGVTVKRTDGTVHVPARVVLWAAGVQASPLGGVLRDRLGAPLDRAGRVLVEPDLTVPGHPEVLVIGDLAAYVHQTGKPLPGVAQVAIQQGTYAAESIAARIAGRRVEPFRYHDRGNMETVGRGEAIADLGRWKLHGYVAWLAWLLIHIAYLIGFENRLQVLLQWAWSYATWNRGARLITGDPPFPLVRHEPERSSHVA